MLPSLRKSTLRMWSSQKSAGCHGVWLQKRGGEDLLKEMVETGTVICRRNPKLPAALLPWPQNQECQHVVESWSKKKRKVETESTGGEAGDLPKFQESWHAQAASVTATTNPVR